MKHKSYEMIIKYLFLILMSAMVLFPILWMLSTSVEPAQEILTGRPHWIPQHFTLEAYHNLFTLYPFKDYFISSLIVSVGATGIAVLFSLLASYGMTRFQFTGKGTFLTYLLVTQMFPSIMLLIPAYKILTTYHLSNTYIGLILMLTSLTVPFCSWLMKGYMESISLELDESAMIDGCPRLRILFQIVSPLALPGIAATAIYAFIQTWNEYMFTYILISSEYKKTLPVGIGQLNGYYRTEWNEMMAACFISALPVVIAFIFLQKYFIASLTAGAVKE